MRKCAFGLQAYSLGQGDKAWGRWTPREGRVDALISAVCSGLFGPLLNLPRENCDEMRGLLDFLRQKPSSVFILLGWSTIPILALMVQSTYPCLVERILVLW